MTAVPTGIGVARVMQRLPPTEKSPWGWDTLLTVSMLAGFGAAGIVGGLNWRRMGRHRLMWITIIASSIAFIAYLFFVSQLIQDIPRFGRISIPINCGVGGGLWLWQENAQHAWKESHLQAERAGWQIPVVVCSVVIMSLLGLYLSTP